jgi:hypothetical protein
MLNTPFVMVFVPVAGACGTSVKENVPETAGAVKALITFAVQSCAPTSSSPFVPLTVGVYEVRARCGWRGPTDGLGIRGMAGVV